MAQRGLAVVTGAAGGIGASICERLVSDGFAVAALDLDENGLAALAESHGSALSRHKVDLTDEHQTRSAIDKIERGEGPIEALVNGNRIEQQVATRLQADASSQPVDVFQQRVIEREARQLP